MHTLTIGLLVMTLILLVGEFITKRGILIWVSLGLLVATGASLFISNGWVLFAICVATSIILFVLLKSWYNTYILPARVYQKDIPDNLVGKTGIVIKEVKRVPQVSGKVLIDNQEYQAVARDARISTNEEVIVEKVDELKIYVRRK